MPERRHDRRPEVLRSLCGWDGTTVPITYTNYAGMLGTYCPTDGRQPNTTELSLENGMYPDVGQPISAYGKGFTRSPVKIASITDGTSNTIGFVETNHSKYSQFGCTSDGCCDWTGAGWWADADYEDRRSLHSIRRTSPSPGPTSRPARSHTPMAVMAATTSSRCPRPAITPAA